MLRIPRQIWFWLVADSTYILRIPLTICGFHLQLRIPQQLYLTIQMSYHLFVDSTNCSGFRKYSCRFRKIACFLSSFEWYIDLGICLWNRKQHRISEKSSNTADSATNLILACCRFHLQLADCRFHLQFADSTYGYGFRNSSIQRYKNLIICLWIPQTVLRSANTVADFANLPVFWAILSGIMI